MNNNRKKSGLYTANGSTIIKSECRATWSKRVDKQLDKIPAHIRDKFIAWLMVIEQLGLESARKTPGYNDEPLLGQRQGQRSIRLNRAYRVIYKEMSKGTSHIIEVLEITKHEY
jgi:proteic killer suppression protein